jgi:hypothetical protein
MDNDNPPPDFPNIIPDEDPDPDPDLLNIPPFLNHPHYLNIIPDEAERMRMRIAEQQRMVEERVMEERRLARRIWRMRDLEAARLYNFFNPHPNPAPNDQEPRWGEGGLEGFHLNRGGRKSRRGRKSKKSRKRRARKTNRRRHR